MPRNKRVNIQAAGKNVTINIDGDGTNAERALEMVREALAQTAEQANESGSEISSAMERVKTAIEYLGLYELLREVGDGIKELIAGSVELGVEIGHLSKQTGISTENLSALKFMSDQTGVGMDVLTKGMKKLSVEMLGAEEGKKQSIQSFERLGLSQADVVAHSHDLYGMLGMIADRFQALPDGPTKAAEAQQLFGKAGMSLIPILNQGSAAIDEMRAKAQALGLILSEETVERMEQIHQKMMEAKGAAEGLGLTLTDVLAPAFTNIAQGAAFAIQKLEELIGLKREVEEDDPEKQKKAAEKVPDKVLGMSDAQRAQYAKDALARQNAAESELSRIEGLRERGAVSEKEYGTKSLALQKQIDDAKLAQAQAHWVTMEQAAEDAQAKFLKIEEDKKPISAPVGMMGDGGFSTGVAQSGAYIEAKKKVSEANAELARSYKELMEAQKGAEKSKPFDEDFKLQDQTGNKIKTEDPITRAASELAMEQAKALAAARKAIDDQQLAELEAQHKMGLVTDQEFYAEKLRLQNDELDAEVESLRAKGVELQALRDKQHSDKTLKRNKDGQSAEELKTAREMLQVQEQIDALEARRGRDSSAQTAEVAAGARAAELEGLKTAAALEKERGNSLEAQIALIQREHELQADKVLNEGGSEEAAANIRATGVILANKLRIEDVTKSITEAEEKYGLARDKVNDAANKDPRLKVAAEKQINQINRQEAAALKELVVQYDALAQELGGPFLEAAAKLHAKMDELNTPSKKGDAAFTKTIVDGVTRMADTITEQTIRGKTSFHDMVKGIEKDLAEMAIKLAEQKIMNIASNSGAAQADGTGFWAQIFGAAAEHHMSGGQINGPAVVGEAGPELFVPSGQGSIVPNALTKNLAENGGGGKGINVTSNVINQTSKPVEAQPSQVSYDSEMRQFIIHTVITDAAQGGAMATLTGG